MHKDPSTPTGTVHRLTLDSELLAGNLVGAPTRRRVNVYIPHGHDGRGLPLLVDIVGFTAGGPVHTNWKNFGENLPERLDRLIASGAMPPVVVAFPDCFTKLGGNQYVNSVAMGRWDDFLRDEVVPFVEQRFDCGGNGRRGLFGKSSGGYGAMVHALLHPDFWSAAAVHSGDMGFELLYRHEFVPVLRALAKQPDIGQWVDAFWAAMKPKDSDVHILMMFAQAASFDPDPAAPYGVRLPVTSDTCELIPDRWAHWLAWDPLTLVESHGPGLSALKALYIDCGNVDQYNLVYGARRMHRRLDAMGVKHHYEEFDDDHTAVDYRMDISLPVLVKALS
ncbi:alpha/beta hydrolase family protein [Mitsuaria sp. 7]|uniref:alpha/beta hydrolase n=1 Tax=Mitsuaria sp. 7 TaxID=1658665 RepID=UPI0007DE1A61|nr:alpha/beta hydrolase-fold protein [Mitsuaria sp. 7]ANH67438.1 enterochelin esterase [Mitsuaria sp. 7]